MGAQDIVVRIRERIAYDQRHYPPADPLLREASAEIVRLRKLLEAYEEGRRVAASLKWE